MAKAKKLPSGRWRVQVFDYKDENGKLHRKSFTADTKKEAELLAMDFQINRKEISKPKNRTIEQCIDDYIKNRTNTLAPSTIREYERTLKNMVPQIKNLKIYDLTDEVLQKHFDAYAQNHSPKTCRNLYGLISAALKAYDKKLVFDVKMPQKEKPQISIPEKEDIKKILEYVKEHDQDMELPIMLGAMAGLRRSEIAALKYEDFNLKNKTVTINKAMVQNNQKQWTIKTTKTVSGNRTIEVTQQIIDIVEQRKNEGKELIEVNPTIITHRFANILEKCNVKHFRFHDLRHYNASVMLALGVPDKYAMHRMGHSTTTMLQTVYQHMISEKEKEVNNCVNNYFENI